MVVHPIESGGNRRRSFKGTLPSLLVHAVLVAGAVETTQHFAAEAQAAPETSTPVVYHAPADGRPEMLRPLNGGAPILTGTMPKVPYVPVIATDPPPIDVGGIIPVSRSELGSGVSGTDPGRLAGGHSLTSTFTGDQVERQAAPLSGNPDPRYPESLRARSVQGSVIARFVVDTAGRVESGSFGALRSDDALFTESVVAALAQSRFRPAEVGGHKVRQLVEQEFTFTVK